MKAQILIKINISLILRNKLEFDQNLITFYT